MNSPHPDQVQAGKIVGQILKLARELCLEPISAEDLNGQLEDKIRELGGECALRGYQPPFTDLTYQHGICLSLNKNVVHTPPTGFLVTPEDVITVDLVVRVGKWHADAARTFTYSSDKKVRNFVRNCDTIFTVATNAINPNFPISNYGKMVQQYADTLGITMVQEFCGHGIGTEIHSEPQIYSFAHESNDRFEPGRAYAVEPIFTAQSYRLVHDPDGWTVTANCLSAHFEDTLFVTDKCIIRLTEEPS